MVRSRLQAAMAVIAMLWGVALLVGWSHPLATRHVICAEHGELLEAASTHINGAESTLTSSNVGKHDICDVDGALPVVASPSLPALSLPDFIAALHQPAPKTAGVRTHVLSVAPKTSPPNA